MFLEGKVDDRGLDRLDQLVVNRFLGLLMGLPKFPPEILKKEVKCDGVVSATGDDEVCVAHGGFDELVVGGFDEAIVL